MCQRTALALLVLTATAACGEAPAGRGSEPPAGGASKDAAAERGGMLDSGHKRETVTGIASKTDSGSIRGGGRGGGMFGSGH